MAGYRLFPHPDTLDDSISVSRAVIDRNRADKRYHARRYWARLRAPLRPCCMHSQLQQLCEQSSTGTTALQLFRPSAHDMTPYGH